LTADTATVVRPTRDLSEIRLVIFDFDGVFTDNTVWVSEDGTESVRCWRSDGLGLSALRRAGIPAMIVSTEVNPVVSARGRKLQIPVRQGVADKAEAVRGICHEQGVDPSVVMFVGNDVNDIPAFGVVGVPVAVADAHPDVYPHVCGRTSRPGGFGAVREVCDWLLLAHPATASSAQT
jgi:3-deoxy-D-manno-octulosonate 8-phosphate phosphatase (KDO 8-P phosphatase)